MASYDDMLKEANEVLFQDKYDDATNSAMKAINRYTFNVKAAPKAGMSVMHTWMLAQEWQKDKDEMKFTPKSKTKFAFAHHDLKLAMTPANDKWNVEAGYPLSKDDVKADGKLVLEGKPGKSNKLEASIAAKFPETSGVKTVLNAKLEQVQEAAKGEWKNKDPKVVFDLAMNIEKEYDVGVKAETDLSSLKKASVQFAKTDADMKMWAGYDHIAEFAKFGVQMKDGDLTKAFEARYVMKSGFSSMMPMGLPLKLAAGAKVNYGKNHNVVASLELLESWYAQMKWTHKVDDHWSVTGVQEFDAAKVGGKEDPYKLWFGATYTL